MWIEFAIAFLFGLALIFVPGATVLCSLGLRGIAVAAAPLVSTLFYVVAGVALGLFGISAHPTWIFAASVIVSLICALFISLRIRRPSRRRVGQEKLGVTRGFLIPAAYVLVGLVVVTVFFLKPMDGADSFTQMADNVWHMDAIKVMVKTGRFSTMQIGTYQDVLGQSWVPLNDTGYYPLGMHILAALIAGTLGCSVALALNVVLAIFMGVCFPLGCWAFLKVLTRDRFVLLAGALTCLGCVSFPMAFLVFGPLYPNLVGQTCLPVLCALIVECLRESNGQRHISKAHAIGLVLGVVGVATIHPNVLFGMTVLTLPYVIGWLGSYIGARLQSDQKKRRWLIALIRVALVLIVAAGWFIAYKLPPFKSVTSFNWEAIFTPLRTVTSIVEMSLRFNEPSWVFAALMLAGIVRLIASARDRLWLIISFLLTALIYFFDAGTEGELKHILSGFWYTDPWRTASLVALAAVPLAAYGAGFPFLLASKLFGKRSVGAHSSVTDSVCWQACVPLVVLIGFGLYLAGISGVPEVTSPYRALYKQVQDIYCLSPEHLYTAEEDDFVAQVMQVLPENAVVINLPADGSISAYLKRDLPVVYRKRGVEEEDTEASKILRAKLNLYAGDEKVQQVVAGMGSVYLLRLDINGYQDNGKELWSLEGVYNPEEWQGIVRVGDGTPGFDTVLAEGGMRLYRLV